jgi:hypothetical protein
MSATVSYTQELVAVDCTCGIAFAIPDALHKQMLDHRSADPGKTVSVYCPLGHQWHYMGKSEATKERERANRAEAQLVAAQDQLEAEQRAHARTRKRVANGVCPCCHRSFVNVKRHMANKHPDYAA